MKGIVRRDNLLWTTIVKYFNMVVNNGLYEWDEFGGCGILADDIKAPHAFSFQVYLNVPRSVAYVTIRRFIQGAQNRKPVLLRP